jgi:hypothetical protein
MESVGYFRIPKPKKCSWCGQTGHGRIESRTYYNHQGERRCHLPKKLTPEARDKAMLSRAMTYAKRSSTMTGQHLRGAEREQSTGV